MEMPSRSSPQYPFTGSQKKDNTVAQVGFHFQGNRTTINKAIFIPKRGAVKECFLSPVACLVSGECRSAQGKKDYFISVGEEFQVITTLCRELADRYSVTLIFDSARFAENAYFIKTREEGYSGKTIREKQNVVAQISAPHLAH